MGGGRGAIRVFVLEESEFPVEVLQHRYETSGKLQCFVSDKRELM